MAVTDHATGRAANQRHHAEERARDALIERYIEPDPNHPGKADARLRQYGVHVWALVGHAKATAGDLASVSRDYDLPVEAVEAAFAFYERHRAVIDDRLEANTV